ncbi:hypothetical protein [Brevibacillus sp. AY1]|uniref:hypothetical protein n=1 Tax=Brevibacillus sp. AY1 TaxID=2807621 RepID=UPI002454D805|nr:hypothetical protein [Brevibacillus sp. AY1]MDH4620180.1 hypothetical protein [Brevibacillus sp. AY1]
MYQYVQEYANQDTRDSWDEWSGFRNSIGSILTIAIDRYNLSTNRILVLGAGNGNDVPIDIIEKYFGEIVIVDIDPKALDSFMGKTKQKEKYTKIVIDLSGFAAQVENLNLVDITDDSLIELIKKISPKVDLSAIHGKFDVIYNANYFTQLTIPLGFKYQQVHVQPPDSIKQAISAITNNTQIQLFQQIEKLLNINGVCLHSSDFLELNYNPITKEANETCKLVMQVTEGLKYIENVQTINSLISEKGLRIEGSTLPVSLIKQIFKTNTVFFLYWPFDHSDMYFKGYVVQLFVFQKL